MPADPRARMSPRHKAVLTLLLGTQFMLTADFSIFNVALPAAAPASASPTCHGWRPHTRCPPPGSRCCAAGSPIWRAGGGCSWPGWCCCAPPRSAAGFTTGALLGGVLTELTGWRDAFLGNVPIAAAILALAPRLVPSGAGDRRPCLDLPGALTVTLGLLALVWGSTTPGQARWALLPAGLLPAAFWRVELRSPEPLAPLHVLRRRLVRDGRAGALLRGQHDRPRGRRRDRHRDRHLRAA
ncbi:hypothetical protein [Nonomuraea sp. NPDC049504]|uniref:hypothetical protein n=1 Tax=Nonomuraea sp. NPDC049504 TaxID=3154729 RepID=UPI0034320C2A